MLNMRVPPETLRVGDELVHQARTLAPEIAAAISGIDASCDLPADLVNRIVDHGFFRMAVPKSYGGLEADPITQVRVVEEFAKVDGSVGWIAMVGIAGAYQSAFLPPEAARRIFSNPRTLCAGQISHTGQSADVVPGGYRLTGRFRFASGCRYATIFQCGVTLRENGQPVVRDGKPAQRILMVPTGNAKIIDTWDTIGMRATGSHDISVEDAFVPHEDSYSAADAAQVNGPLYVFRPLFLCAHLGVPLGIARGVLDAAIDACKSKRLPPDGQLLRDEPKTQEAIARAETMLAAARAYAYGTLNDLWEILRSGKQPDPHLAAAFRTSKVHAYDVARQVTSSMMDVLATSAVSRQSVFDRALRDLATAAQHRQLHPRLYLPAGRIFLGLDPADPSFGV
jgi:alkylation response protein AidB-like acyl-CoA dehydrogenase